jgi:hypothetical protein
MTDDHETPQCPACHSTYDLAGWRELPVVGGGTLGTTKDGVELATGVSQMRRCACGATLTHVVHFPEPMPPSEAAVALALILTSA